MILVVLELMKYDLGVVTCCLMAWSYHVWGNRCLPRGYFSQLICSLVVPSSDVIELQPVELVFQASDFVAVGLYLSVVAVGVLHDLVNDKLRVATSVEAPNP
jgi:hypothetical protein